MTQLSESLEGIKCCSVQLVFMHTHTQGALENDSSSVTNDYHLIHLVGAGFFVISTLWGFIASWIIFAPPVRSPPYMPVIMYVCFCINAKNRQLKLLPGCMVKTWIDMHTLWTVFLLLSHRYTIHTVFPYFFTIESTACLQVYENGAVSAVNINYNYTLSKQIFITSCSCRLFIHLSSHNIEIVFLAQILLSHWWKLLLYTSLHNKVFRLITSTQFCSWSYLNLQYAT